MEAPGSSLPQADLEAAVRVRGGLPLLRARAARAARGAALGARVVYLGGSVTQQHAPNGWRPHFHAWLGRALPTPLGHDAVCAALGNCGSKVLAFMLHEWVLTPHERPPDLVIVEAAINDGDALLETGDATAIRRALEGIVRGVRTAAPRAELLFVYAHMRTELPRASRTGTLAWVNDEVPDAAAVYRQASPSIHEQVAEHYGIPSVNVSTALRALTTAALDDAFRDDCHTTPAGGALVASVVAACVTRCLAAEGGGGQLALPPCLDPLLWAGGRTHAVLRADLDLALDASGAPLRSLQTWDVDPLTGERGQWWLLAPGDSLAMNFTGSALALITHIGPDAGVLRCKVMPAGCSPADAAESTIQLFDRYSYYYRLAVVVLAEGLEPAGRHSARVTLQETPPDRSAVTRPLQKTVAGPLRLWLSHALTLSSAAHSSRALPPVPAQQPAAAPDLGAHCEPVALQRAAAA